MGRKAGFRVVALLTVELAAVPALAQEVSGGVNVGAVLVGTRPRYAVSPHAGVSWRTQGGLLFALREGCSVLPAIDAHGMGVYSHTSVEVGYAWKSGRFSVGPLLAIYSVPACGPAGCGSLSGLSPGVRGQVDYYLFGPLGISASANVDWLTGSSVLPAGVAAMVLAGPVLKWSSE